MSREEEAAKPAAAAAPAVQVPAPSGLDEQQKHLSALFSQLIIAVGVVDFHHSYGPIVEYVYPSFLVPSTNSQGEKVEKEEENKTTAATENDYYVNCNLPDCWKNLAFFCLPDGVHSALNEAVYFHLPVPKGLGTRQTSVFGVSCVRQIARSELLHVPADVTRSFVQKSIFVICRKPLFGHVFRKLSIVTETLFRGRDIRKAAFQELLTNLYQSLNAKSSNNPSSSISNSIASNPPLLQGKTNNSRYYQGTTLRAMTVNLKNTLLVLFKLLLLERRIVILSASTKKLAQYIISLLSLLPGDYLGRIDEIQARVQTATCQIEEYSMENGLPFKQQQQGQKAKSTTDDSDNNVLAYPLVLYLNAQSIVQPYLPLNEVDFILNRSVKSFIVGTSNLIITKLENISYDVFINIDELSVVCNDPILAEALILSNADRLFAYYLYEKVISDEQEVESNPTDIIKQDTLDPFYSEDEIKFNDNWIRNQFECYLSSFLLSLLYEEEEENKNHLLASLKNHSNNGTNGSNDSSSSKSPLTSDYNSQWVNLWKETRNYAHWSSMVNAKALLELTRRKAAAADANSSTLDNANAVKTGNSAFPQGLVPGHPFAGKIGLNEMIGFVYDNFRASSDWLKTGKHTFKSVVGDIWKATSSSSNNSSNPNLAAAANKDHEMESKETGSATSPNSNGTSNSAAGNTVKATVHSAASFLGSIFSGAASPSVATSPDEPTPAKK